MPGASRSELAGWLGDMLKVRVAAPPENGKANAAVVALLARELGVRSSTITIIAGKAAQKKVIEVQGLSVGEVMARLSGRG